MVSHEAMERLTNIYKETKPHSGCEHAGNGAFAGIPLHG